MSQKILPFGSGQSQHHFAKSGHLNSESARQYYLTMKIRVCLARIKSAFEMNNMQGGRVTCMDDIRPVAEFWRRTGARHPDFSHPKGWRATALRERVIDGIDGT